MNSKQILGRTGAAAVSLLVLVGCNGSFAGKGSLTSTSGGTAPLTFRVICPVGSDTVSGTVKYTDRASRVQLNGKATHVGSNYVALTCDGDRSEGHYTGSYTSSYGAPGTFVMDLVASAGECNGKGLVTIAATSGVHDGYTNTSCFKGTIRPLDRASIDLPDVS